VTTLREKNRDSSQCKSKLEESKRIYRQMVPRGRHNSVLVGIRCRAAIYSAMIETVILVLKSGRESQDKISVYGLI
jgi:hypothetical protein